MAKKPKKPRQPFGVGWTARKWVVEILMTILVGILGILSIVWATSDMISAPTRCNTKTTAMIINYTTELDSDDEEVYRSDYSFHALENGEYKEIVATDLGTSILEPEIGDMISIRYNEDNPYEVANNFYYIVCTIMVNVALIIGLLILISVAWFFVKTILFIIAVGGLSMFYKIFKPDRVLKTPKRHKGRQDMLGQQDYFQSNFPNQFNNQNNHIDINK